MKELRQAVGIISKRTGKPINTKITGRPSENIIGKKFGKLVVISEKEHLCECKCECGKTKLVNRKNLKNGHTRSCGCLYDIYKNPIKLNNKRLYNIWEKMRCRCNNKNYPEFYLYGGRGIKICDEWGYNFNTFAEWALNNGYTTKLSIDRTNNNGNYEPDNCRWATNFEQANNKRNNRFLEINGIVHTVSEWARVVGCPRQTLQSRIMRGGDNSAIDKINELMAQKFIDSMDKNKGDK